MRVPIKDARELAKRRRLTHVIIFAYDGATQHVATFGGTTEQSGQAADLGNQMKTALGWPEHLLKQPSRVRKLLFENMALKESIDALKTAGRMGSNACYNLSQSELVEPRTRQVLKECYEAWSAAMRQLKEAAKAIPESPK